MYFHQVIVPKIFQKSAILDEFLVQDFIVVQVIISNFVNEFVKYREAFKVRNLFMTSFYEFFFGSNIFNKIFGNNYLIMLEIQFFSII
jgi:hypothetical protein